MSAARRTVLLGAILVLAGLAGAPALSLAEASPEAFLKSIYDRYIGDAKKALGVPLILERRFAAFSRPRSLP